MIKGWIKTKFRWKDSKRKFSKRKKGYEGFNKKEIIIIKELVEEYE